MISRSVRLRLQKISLICASVCVLGIAALLYFGFVKVVAVIEHIPEKEYAAQAMVSLAGVIPSERRGTTTKDFEDLVSVCNSAREDLSAPCMNGMMESGNPGKEYQTALLFCGTASLSDEERSVCMRAVIGGVRMYYSKEKYEDICGTIEDKYKAYCVAR